MARASLISQCLVIWRMEFSSQWATKSLVVQMCSISPPTKSPSQPIITAAGVITVIFLQPQSLSELRRPQKSLPSHSLASAQTPPATGNFLPPQAAPSVFDSSADGVRPQVEPKIYFLVTSTHWLRATWRNLQLFKGLQCSPEGRGGQGAAQR